MNETGRAHIPMWAHFPSSPIRVFLLAGFFAILALGCASAPKVESYYVAEGVLQYFVHSYGLSGPTSRVEMDFSYRNSGSSVNEVTCNFTFLPAENVPRSVTEASFLLDGGKRCLLGSLKILFVERGARSIRVSTKMALEDFRALTGAKEILLEVDCDGRSHALKPSPEFLAAMKEAGIEMFD